MTPLKEVYNLDFFNTFLMHLKKVKPQLNKDDFRQKIFTETWSKLELKQRMHHITEVLHTFLSDDFITAVAEIKVLVKELEAGKINGGFEYLFLPHYIELYGQSYLTESIVSFETITPFVSCEFAIRPFIIKNPKYVMAKMESWCFHPNYHLRRLASEGCRPRLPWATGLPAFKKDPNAILPILKNLLNDDEIYVRKSVANNLNDISKDHKEFLIAFTEEHYGETDYVNWILKHANRNLLKQAEPRILQIFGFGNQEQIDIQNFKINKTEISLGENLYISFNVINNANKPSLIRLEYAVYYLKKNGSLSKKIFQISQKEHSSLSKTSVQKKQHFKPISTRKYHFGKHKISIIANGKEFDTLTFNLKET